ncbi:sulfotransferase domain-containing protein [Candidatus Woesearchaeota archaeon]|nr:sulfotransferase domain-containing protein [Candidatus Woesearchaeota archaeon]
MKNLYLHIGLPKTGTTFLQKNIFCKLKAVNYIEVREEKSFWNLIFNDYSAADEKKVKNFVAKRSKNGNNFVSFENFSGDSYFPNSRKRKELLKTIKTIFSDYNLTIILILREQTDLVSSMYKHFLHLGGTLNPEQFAYGKESDFDIEKYFYDELITEVKSIFGKNKVHIDLYENFKSNKIKFLESFLGFLGEKTIPQFEDKLVYKGYGAFQMKTIMFLNRYFQSQVKPHNMIPMLNIPGADPISLRLLIQNRIFEMFPSKKYELPKGLKQKIKQTFLRDNLQSNKKYSLNLTKNYL